MGFKCLKAIEPLRGGTLLETHYLSQDVSKEILSDSEEKCC